MATPDLEEELNVLARFIGRAVGVPGDLDALEALTKVKYHIKATDEALREIESGAHNISEENFARQIARRALNKEESA